MSSSTSSTKFLDSASAKSLGYATHDWADTLVGYPSGWSPLLRHSVSLMLEAQFPMFIAWGAQLALLYNSAYLPLIGAKHPTALGNALEAVWAELWGSVQPLAERALAGEPTFAADVPRVMLINGRMQTCWFTFSYSPIRDDDGDVAGILCVICETTERVRLEARRALQLEAVDELEELTEIGDVAHVASKLLGQHLGTPHVFYAEVDEAQDAFTVTRDWSLDASKSLEGRTGRPDAYGAQAISQLRSGRPLVVTDVHIDDLTSNFAQAYADLGVRSVLALPLVKSGVLSATLNVCDSVPRDWTVEDLAMASDIAERTWHAVERVRAAEALRRADRRKDEFLAMLAHELRNPLAPIRSASELLPLLSENPGRIKAIGATIGRQVEHMAGLVDDLLDVSRVTTGLIKLVFEWVDVVAAVRDAAEQVQASFAHRPHHYCFDFPPQVVYVVGDHKRLVQIVANLLTNAAKYSAEESNIELSVWRDGTAVRIVVRDNGIGIEKEFLPHIFELFTQGRRASARSEGGLGIGLPLTKTLVELHGGTITAASEGANLGSTFTVWIPGRALDSAVGGEGQGFLPTTQYTGRRVLVVDDNVDAADAIMAYFEALGHEAAAAYDGEAALALAQSRKFDACVLDIGLPGLDGNELALRLRKTPNTREAIYIAVTGYGAPTDLQAGVRAGFDHYLVKPVDMQELLALLGAKG